MTDLDLLKKYIYPYYQTDDDTYLELLLVDYSRPAKTASILWMQSATLIWSGGIKAYGTGSTSTSFQSLKEVSDFCRAQARVYRDMDKVNRHSGSIAVAVDKMEFVGGASDEYIS